MTIGFSINLPQYLLRGDYPDSKVHGDNMEPTCALLAQMGPMLAPWTLLSG